MKNTFKGKIVVITGATKGIGNAIAKQCVELGACVIGTGTSVKHQRNKGIEFFPLDLNDDRSIEDFIDFLKKKKKIDVLINNAGINKPEKFTELSKENWDKTIKVNLTGPMLLSKEVAKIMKRKRKGHILNVSSIWGVIAKEKRHAYAASKTGLIGLTRTMALDLAQYGILVNALCPGFTMTVLTKSTLTNIEIKSLTKEVPLGRFASVNEIAKTAIFLCSEANSYMTGQEIIIDGGFVIR